MQKQSSIAVLCLLLLFISCRNETGVTIRGEISNLESPYILATHISAAALVIDTIVVDNGRGRFVHRAEIDTATVFTFYMNDFMNSIVVFADKGQRISVRGDAQMTDLMQITGNEINNELTFFKNENEELLRQRKQLVLNYQRFNETDTTEIVPYTMMEELLRINTLNRELSLRAEEFIAENPTRFSSLILINDFFTDTENPEALERVLGHLEGDVLRTRLARQLQAYFEKINSSAEGEQVPYFQMIDRNNDTISSHDFFGKYMLLSFVSSDGLESREMLNRLRESYETLSEDSVQFITIYIDSDTYPVRYLESDSLTWTVVAESRGWGAEIVDKFNIQFVPFNILISPEGIIQDRNIPAQELPDVIRREEEEEED